MSIGEQRMIERVQEATERAMLKADPLMDDLEQWLKQQPTWLDHAAMAAIQGLLVDYHIDGMRKQMLAATAYDIVEAMLAEKRKREGGAS